MGRKSNDVRCWTISSGVLVSIVVNSVTIFQQKVIEPLCPNWAVCVICGQIFSSF